MRALALLTALAMAAIMLMATGAAHAASAPPYRTTTQAQRYLEARYTGATGDRTWAYCSNGYYSRHEQRTGRHFSQRHRDRLGRDLYASFACSVWGLAMEDRNLYVQTRPDGRWYVAADR